MSCKVYRYQTRLNRNMLSSSARSRQRHCLCKTQQCATRTTGTMRPSHRMRVGNNFRSSQKGSGPASPLTDPPPASPPFHLTSPITSTHAIVSLAHVDLSTHVTVNSPHLLHCTDRNFWPPPRKPVALPGNSPNRKAAPREKPPTPAGLPVAALECSVQAARVPHRSEEVRVPLDCLVFYHRRRDTGRHCLRAQVVDPV